MSTVWFASPTRLLREAPGRRDSQWLLSVFVEDLKHLAEQLAAGVFEGPTGERFGNRFMRVTYPSASLAITASPMLSSVVARLPRFPVGALGCFRSWISIRERLRSTSTQARL